MRSVHFGRNLASTFGLEVGLPVFLGVEHEVFQAVTLYLQKVEKHIETFLKESSPHQFSKSQDRACPEFFRAREPDKVNLLFAPAGSGKTRSIELLLSKNWGLYLLPCNLPPASTNNLYRSRRMQGSSDTWTLWNTFQEIRKLCPNISVNSVPIQSWYRLLLFSRKLILDRFLGMIEKNGDTDGPAKWLAFQTSCSPSCDPFNTLFQLLILDSRPFSWLASRLTFDTPYLDRLVKDDTKGLYFCIDEAQCDLDEAVTDSLGVTTPMLGIELQCIFDQQASFCQIPKPGNVFIAGTSLRLSEATSVVQDIRLRGTFFSLRGVIPEPLVMADCKKHADYPLLATSEDFRKLLTQHGVSKKMQDPGIIKIIEENSRPLRGRYRWSVRYIERLNRLVDTKLTPEVIKIEAEKTAKEAKDQLKERLEALQKKQHVRLLDQLCSVAIQSDLLGKPTIFENDKKCKMISLAFAVVAPMNKDESQYRSQLREQLALEAIMEFFRGNWRAKYDEKLTSFLYSEQNDAGALGKVAEWFLAWVSLCAGVETRMIDCLLTSILGKELRKCLCGSNRMIGSPEDFRERRRDFLRVLGKARHLTCKGKVLEGEVKDFARNYCLVEGARTGHCYDGTPSGLRIWEWMSSIRNSEKIPPVASFYFPDSFAGPDLLFALKRRGTSDEKAPFDPILCIVQVRIPQHSLSIFLYIPISDIY
jgi:hypothetical protein